jgi:hypothetical protein
MTAHSDKAAVALRELLDGGGGKVLVVYGEPGEGALFPAGVGRPPVPTLLEAVLAYLSGPGVYANVWVLSAAGEQTPAGVYAGSARHAIRETSCGWVLRGPLPAADGSDRKESAAGDDDDLLAIASGRPVGGPALPDGPGRFQLFEGGLTETVAGVLNWVEAACGRAPRPNGEYAAAAVVPPGRTLVLLDAHLLFPTGPADAEAAARMEDQLRRRLVNRLNRIPADVVAGSRADLVLLAPSRRAVGQLREGRLIHDQLLRFLPGRRREGEEDETDTTLLRMHWRLAPAAEMRRVDRDHPLADSFQLAPADARRSIYDLLQTVKPRRRPDPLEELQNMTGLGKVKAKLREVFNLVDLYRHRESSGLATGDRPMLHLAFAGNPGTGKTTVARIVARLYARSGLLSGGKLTEVTGGDLVAGYVGQTRGKTKETLEAAAGGVLFIDEAYDLIPKGDNDFTGEVLALLMTWMTERRRDLAVILAGYPDEMQELLASNPGTDRRIEWVEFEDYTDDELMAIARAKAAASGEVPGAGAEQELLRKLRDHRAACANAGRPFGNAGEVERLLMKVRAALGARLRSGGDGVTILPEDVRGVELPIPESRRPGRAARRIPRG